jgi:cyclopropane-fatty-acyl-phospholipid synthase
MALLDRLGSLAAPVTDPVARLQPTDKVIDRHNVRAHYDVGNDFYALMLDPTMTYSCALFDRPQLGLQQAQQAKLERLCSLLQLSAEDHLVEIGTGWGGMAMHAATRHGCRVTTTTVSAAQHEYSTKRIVEAGVADRITVLECDYRDLRGTHDKLVSVEMIEAVSWRDHQTYFDACARLLRPGGRAALQAIVIEDASFDRAKRHDDFIRRTIFPGGCLPSIASIRRDAARAGLRLVELHDIGEHYPATLRAWRANLKANGEQVAALGFDTEFCRLWDLYLTYCEAGFLEGHISDVQIVFQRC